MLRLEIWHLFFGDLAKVSVSEIKPPLVRWHSEEFYRLIFPRISMVEDFRRLIIQGTSFSHLQYELYIFFIYRAQFLLLIQRHILTKEKILCPCDNMSTVQNRRHGTKSVLLNTVCHLENDYLDKGLDRQLNKQV